MFPGVIILAYWLIKYKIYNVGLHQLSKSSFSPFSFLSLWEGGKGGFTYEVLSFIVYLPPMVRKTTLLKFVGGQYKSNKIASSILPDKQKFS
jgi:hypothetical protein